MKGYVLVSIALAWLAAAWIAGCVGQPTALAPAEESLPATAESVETRETQGPTGEATGLPTPGLVPQKEEIDVTPQPSLESSEINLPAAAEPSVRLARADLAQRLGLAAEAIKLVSAEAVEWSDASLGCPQPGMMYAQVITPGFLVVLEAGGQTYEYHTDMGRFTVLCEQGGGAAAPAVAPTESVPTEVTPPPAGWKTFVSPTLHVALDYPPDWSVTEQGGGVIFTPAQGASIQLAPVDPGGLPPEDYLNQQQLPNTRCSTTTNAYGLSVRDCLDTLSGSHSAYLILTSAQGPARLVVLTALRRADLQVFQAMIESVRLQTP